MLYFLDDIIQEIIGRQSPNLFFSKEIISDHESHAQIAVHLYFKGPPLQGSHWYSIPPKQTEKRAFAEREGKCVSQHIISYFWILNTVEKRISLKLWKCHRIGNGEFIQMIDCLNGFKN